MRTVKTFWQTAEDEKAFLEYLGTTGDVLAYPFGKHQSTERLCAQPLSEYVLRPCHSLFTLEEFCGYTVILSFDREGTTEFSVSPILSCVISYNPGLLKGRVLTPANVCAYWETRTEKGWVKKPDGFIKWVKAVFRWLRKHACERIGNNPLPMTRSVAEALQSGLELIQY